jgi:glyoxylase-like metal-dependent hydrolase (beta-lactamase superfamily II)
MKVHHLDCATMCPLGRPWVNGDGSFFSRGLMVGHCLLVETANAGLVLIDSGFGCEDMATPGRRLGHGFTFLMAAGSGRTKPAKVQIEALGFRADDVRHVIPTHLDVDHAGGLPDFPKAKVHIHANEQRAALEPPTFMERERYRRCHFAHGPDWVTYATAGEAWKGFPAVRELAGLGGDFLCVPMHGHTRGHWLVAVNAGSGARGPRWLLHCGDAYFHRGVIRPSEGPVPSGLTTFENNIGTDGKRVQENHERLRELAGRNDADLSIFSAHDPVELDRLRGAATNTADLSAVPAG